MKKKKASEKENEWKGVLVDENQDVKMFKINENKTEGYFYQVGESNVTPESFIVTSTNGGNYDINKDYCNVGVSKLQKQKRIEFEYNVKFWQLLPSVAVNLSMKEIEFVWLCFGMYVSFENNKLIKNLNK